MPRHIPTIVGIASLVSLTAGPARAGSQTAASQVQAIPVTTQVSSRSGRVHGTVRDADGTPVSGVAVIAMGATLASVKSDWQGRFSLALPAGEYILRATRDGYLSTFREAVRVQTSVLHERNITLVRQGDEPVVSRAGMGGLPAGPVPAVGDAESGHSHSEVAWRLRRLTRTILRDGSPIDTMLEPSETSPFVPQGSPFGRATARSTETASSLFANIDFDGQLNFLTTGLFDAAGGWLARPDPRGVAYFAFGSPLGLYGDWDVRGAIATGERSSWVFLGEFRGAEQATHAYRVGMSYSAQGYDPRFAGRLEAATTEARHVAGIYGYDRWSVRRGLTLDYGLRVDRYDYVEAPEFLSPSAGLRAEVLPGTVFTARASRRVIAPGAEEFLPPDAPGPWLPPERTFLSLAPGAPFKTERVHHVEVGVEQRLGRGRHAAVVALRRFHQRSFDQVATLFGLDAESAGHYYVANPGNVAIDGWGAGISSPLSRRLQARVDYLLATSDWGPERHGRALRRRAPSTLRLGRERLHDLTTTLDATIPETSTRVTMVYRMNSAFSRADGESRPLADGRFDVQVHQALPYQPLRGGKLEVLFAVRTLFRDSRETVGFYDELLTVAPPMRVIGGFQITF